MYDSHTGENIAALLKEAVTDNAANTHVAAEHSLNLPSQKALKSAISGSTARQGQDTSPHFSDAAP